MKEAKQTYEEKHAWRFQEEFFLDTESTVLDLTTEIELSGSKL